MTEREFSAKSILDISDLTVAYRYGDEWLEAVRDVSLSIHQNEIYGLVGESGSGKTTLALAVMNYLGKGGSIRLGKIKLGEIDLLSLPVSQLREVWGKKITFVPQNPQSALNPSLQIGNQMIEILQHQLDLSRKEAEAQTLEWLERVKIADPDRVVTCFPHQISGGMQQRIMIAMALCTSPELIILDEPTTNLDVTTQAMILNLVSDLIQEQQAGVLYVTHNLGVVAQLCDRVGVMYASELVEESGTQDLFNNPLHPYTLGLLDSLPRLGNTKNNSKLQAITGQIPPLGKSPTGCIFRTRCPIAIESCCDKPPRYHIEGGRYSRCHRWQEILSGDVNAHQGMPADYRDHPAGQDDIPPILKLNQLEISFPMPRSFGEIFQGKPAQEIRVVNKVDLKIPASSTVGLVGESGSGKTTIARGIMGLEKKKNGWIEFLQNPLPDKLSQRDLRTLQLMRIVFQNPQQALNPYLTVGESLRKPLVNLLGLSKSEADTRVIQLLEAVKLSWSYAGRLPNQLSGGEIQRVAIARAIASNPELLVLDEPISSLDVSVQASILNLVQELQEEHHNSLLFISHDLTIVSYIADRIAVIYLGTLMEIVRSSDLFHPPYHPYTESLLSAIPKIETRRRRIAINLSGEIPSPANLPSGCPFHTRCPRYLGEICRDKKPPWQVDRNTGKRIFCHIPLDKLANNQTIMVTSDPRKRKL